MPLNEENAAPEHRVAELLELFYPVHYKTGIAFEDAMRNGKITRKQTAILWLIHAEGFERTRMRRKDIERSLQTWFEVSSSAITKALRGMSRAPLNLVKIVEDPESAREKQVLLTTKGERFLDEMITEGRRLLGKMIEQLSDQEIDGGIVYLRKVTSGFEAALQKSTNSQGAAVIAGK